MFFILHRLYTVSWISLILAVSAWLYVRSGVSEPIVAWYQVWQNTQGTATRSVERLTGKVTRVIDGTSIIVRSADRQLYSVGLVGAARLTNAAPTKAPKHPEIDPGKARLNELVLSNEVEVLLISLDPQHRGLGVVKLGETNVNALLIESGLAQLRRDFIKGLPVREQYTLIRAGRKAEKGHLVALTP